MIYLKTDEEIELLRENNVLVSKTLAEVGRHIRPGVTTKELDTIAEDFIRAHGAVRVSGISRFVVHFGKRAGCSRYPILEMRPQRGRHRFGRLRYVYEGVCW